MMSKAVEIALLMKTDRAAAADKVHELIVQLQALEASLRGGYKDTGGVRDRCVMEVRGPDGALKQRADTGG